MGLAGCIHKLFVRPTGSRPAQTSQTRTSPLASLSDRLAARRSTRAAPRLAVEVSEVSDEVLVRLRGEAGYLEGTILDAALLPLVARCPARVTFDLSQLQLVSSLVLGIIVSFFRRAVRGGCRVQLVAPRPEMREAVERAGLTTFLPEPTQQTCGAIPCVA
jgi:anti-anti-sigma factor